MLRYPAGAPLDGIRGDITAVIAAYEQATKFVQEFARNETFPPLRFVEIDEYERV